MDVPNMLFTVGNINEKISKETKNVFITPLRKLLTSVDNMTVNT